MFKHLLITSYALLISVASFAGTQGSYTFPDGPISQMTPGVLCTHPDSYRYDEHIPYCDRAVSSTMKKKIIAAYDSQFGFTIQKMNRNDFKIDHLIPLSIGGANDIGNLWPQHKSVYAFSDKMEATLSNLMLKNRIKQVQAIQAIKDCKLHLEKCEQIEADLNKLLQQN